ncbi:rem2- and rab-like small GTPase 1 [Plakobranchus ocellatus]|uniref:Ciliogenesis and planar polarity effector 2 n=1 Tax=Plakobranchus ocellatus TaxID=259542 RepID=A0AAV3ZI53_9GAST|nr:rem2- and rab-like small GTPase 1 [Plakobranchus ocellatus]
MLKTRPLLILDWLQMPEGREILRSISSIQGDGLKPYGLLERPILPASTAVEDVHYKLAVVGKGGVGKTSTIAFLSGRPVPESHCETAGIQTTRMYWPVKIAHLNKAVLMNLTLWDTGEIAIKKFDHILPACKSGVDGILFLFSFVDKGSWEEIPHLLSRFTDPGDKLAKIVIGTKYPLQNQSMCFKDCSIFFSDLFMMNTC